MFYRNISKIRNCHRNFSSQTTNTLSSKEIRKLFLEFFMNQHVHDHKFIRSSPVVPFCDPTLAFVNAGMNQFKSIFLGKINPVYKRVTNSQKCVRVGGKHNDISIIGKDGYHHTFFEMLGNWSFGDYYKKEACEMALTFLKDTLRIDTSRLYVTYFGGDDKLNLPADKECYEIWRSLGIQEDRLLPFGSHDNFWEMGLTGPCGTCTEIHIDHLAASSLSENRGKYINTGRDDLTELWNLVFIEYNRDADNSITPLNKKHVDTGMGMERLTAIIQGKRSNYDTDLFLPIIERIQEICKSPQYKGVLESNDENYQLDTAYRILADHSRMMTACLSDGMLPDQNQKLRRIIRTSLSLAQNIFHNENLTKELIPIVVEILGSTYPEMMQKYENVLEILENEKEIFKIIKSNCSKEIQEILNKYPKLNELNFIMEEYPGFINAFKELQSEKNSFQENCIPGKFLFKLRDTYGLSDDVIEQIAEIENLKLDLKGLQHEIENAKQKSKKVFENYNNSSLIAFTSSKCEKTIDNLKYLYTFDKNKGLYNIIPVEAQILGIFEDGKQLESIGVTNNSNNIGLITNYSNFYSESGGQECDQGIIEFFNDAKEIFQFDVIGIEKINDCIIHIGRFSSNNPNSNHQLKVEDTVTLKVDEIRRTLNTLHHTGTHLLNAAVHNFCRKVVYQISSSVTSGNLKLELGIIGKKLELNDIIEIEDLIRQVISSSIPITLSIKNASDILEMSDVLTVPGEIYPEVGLHLIEIQNDQLNFKSKELCCGTHAKNTSELQEFCITNFKQISRNRYSFTAVCENLAKEALNSSKDYVNRIDELEMKFKNDPECFDVIEVELKKFRNDLLHNNRINLSYVLKMKCLDKINEIGKMVKEVSRSNLKNFVEMEMMNILQQSPKENHPFIIHFLKSSSLMETVPLQKATKLCVDRPVLVISLDDGKIKARCCVPKNKISNGFSASKWLHEFSEIFKGQISAPKGQNADEVCNMKAKKVLSSIFHDQLDLAIQRAKEFALKNL